MIEGTFLGTSSAFPTAKRNHPSVYLMINGERMLFDCGEGTQRQIRKAGLSPSVDYIFITHWHGDHSLGLGGIIQSLNMMKSNKELQIFGPSGTEQGIKNILMTYKFYNQLAIKTKSVNALTEKTILERDNYSVSAINVEHSVKCLAYKIKEKDVRNILVEKLAAKGIKPGKFLSKLKEGKDVVYNGIKLKYKELTYLKKGKSLAYVTDLRYSRKVISFIKGVDTLIIESTFGEEFQKSYDFFHLNIKEAMLLAKSSGAKEVYFVHTSQRYENDDSMVKSATAIYSKMKCSFRYSFPDDFDRFAL
ncbi:MAG: ribonuclease Z [Candidatus Parvarchaeota archaeon]|nr:ribonuclease Z [Candidatus Parvarchaeum tengchongense]MCW1312206.1 ribonuclease Z [Candidatus Parvarchaeum tengchongense]